MVFELYEADTFSLIVTWTLDSGGAKDLEGASVEALVRRKAGGSNISLTGNVFNGAAGEIRITAPAFTFEAREYEIQAVVTSGDTTRTWAEEIKVLRSLSESGT